MAGLAVEPERIETIQARLRSIDAELTSLARPSMRSGIGSVGFRTLTQDEPFGSDWLQVDL